MTKHTGPADPNNDGRHIHPSNTSRSMSRGGRVIDEALRGTRDMHVGGGCKNPVSGERPAGERSLDEHLHDVERGGKRG